MRLQEVVADLTPAAFVDGASQYYPEMTEDVRPDEHGARRVAARLWRHQWGEFWSGDGKHRGKRKTTETANVFESYILHFLQLRCLAHQRLAHHPDKAVEGYECFVPELGEIFDRYGQVFPGRFKPRLCWGMTPLEKRAALFALGEYPIAFVGEATKVDGRISLPITLPVHDILHLIYLSYQSYLTISDPPPDFKRILAMSIIATVIEVFPLELLEKSALAIFLNDWSENTWGDARSILDSTSELFHPSNQLRELGIMMLWSGFPAWRMKSFEEALVRNFATFAGEPPIQLYSDPDRFASYQTEVFSAVEKFFAQDLSDLHSGWLYNFIYIWKRIQRGLLELFPNVAPY